MGYTKGHYNLDSPSNPSDFAEQLGLKSLGISIFVLEKGEGFDFFHSHRDQEEIYFCLDGSVDLLISDQQGNETEHIVIERGNIVRVDPQTLRAIGNRSSNKALVLIAGACPHTYPAGFGHHDVISDVLSVVGQGSTGFTMPKGITQQAVDSTDQDC